MESVNKVIGKFTRIIKQLERVSKENLYIASHKGKLAIELEEDIKKCMSESQRANKIKKKFEELLEL